jgi:hypothetical protein
MNVMEIDEKKKPWKSDGNTPGQARTANLGIALHKILSYKYRALTDCATGVLGDILGKNLKNCRVFIY